MTDSVSFAVLGVLASVLAAWPLARRPTARHEFVILRRDSNTDSVARLLRRICAVILSGLPYGAVVLVAGTAIPTDPPTPLRDVLLFALLASMFVGVGMSWLLYPFATGLLSPNPAVPDAPKLGAPSRLVLAVLGELRSAVRGFDAVWQVCWTRRTTVQRLEPPWRTFFGAMVVFGVFCLATYVFVFEFVVIVSAAYLYALPAYLPFLITEDELVSLNERPFLIAFGVALLVLNDVLMRLREWASRRSRAFSSSVAMVVADVFLLTLLFFLSGDDSGRPPLSVAGAVFVGVIVALEALLLVDLGHALVSAQVAGRRTTPPLRADMGVLLAGQRLRSRLARRRGQAQIVLSGARPFSRRGLARLSRAGVAAVNRFLSEDAARSRAPRKVDAGGGADADAGLDGGEPPTLSPQKSSEM
ncbi:hypothetical protein G5V58_03995 [Nocardioides anomalus]|uniref:Uncharacterized protein n=1 Tax=Nocardioides anomalus TaxID=2712223 RepID=A0A6G6W9Y4_9ACTN|nr:hypothetical protein [Nocardioides anomalus]QIG42044.1 hypothetical protein G5V58_03995 [Nocardioides anomalus]